MTCVATTLRLGLQGAHATHVLILSHDLSHNAVGRSYVFWLLCQELGWSAEVRGPGQLWAPLRGTAFAADVETWSASASGRSEADAARRSDVIVAVKPWRASFGLGRRLATKHARPLIVDIDDPDLPGISSSHTPTHVRWLLRAKGYSSRRVRDLEAQIRTRPLTVSNPALQHRYGGTVIPHVRTDPGGHADRAPNGAVRVGFLGTARAHKGVAALRTAVGELHHHREAVELVLLGSAPRDARSWERWLGTVAFDELPAHVRTIDIVALPSRDDLGGREQLPAKLIDAMIGGAAVVASDLPPIRWALGETGVLVPPGDSLALRTALRDVAADADRRHTLGGASRARALAHFTPAAVAPAFANVVEHAGGAAG